MIFKSIITTTLVLLISNMSFANTGEQVTLSVEADKILESEQLNMVKIIDPIIKVSNEDFFGYSEFIPFIINKPGVGSDTQTSNLTAQYICSSFSYGTLIKSESYIEIDNSVTPALGFKTSTNPKSTSFRVHNRNSYPYNFNRTVVCRITN